MVNIVFYAIGADARAISGLSDVLWIVAKYDGPDCSRSEFDSDVYHASILIYEILKMGFTEGDIRGELRRYRERATVFGREVLDNIVEAGVIEYNQAKEP